MTARVTTRWAARILVLVGALLAGSAPPARAADAVTIWTIEADRLGGGAANWHTLAIMHMAMHDAVNAVRPVYARWAAPAASEPQAAGAAPEAALAAAAARVLIDLHPDQRVEIASLLGIILGRLPQGPAIDSGVRLGESIAEAAVARRAEDGFTRIRDFVGSDVPGHWRPTPPNLATSSTSDTRPFLFADAADAAFQPPPVPGGPAYLRDADEVRRVGALIGGDGTVAQYQAAVFWAHQSSQRGFMRLAVRLLDADPRRGGLAEHARIMSQLATAMADSAILAWVEKERFMFWRPVTAIREGGFGVEADPFWRPFLDTPPHPDYPSGHAADCFTAAGVLRGAFGTALGPIDYAALAGIPGGADPGETDPTALGMGQHAQPGGVGAVTRHFASVEDAAEECALSRIWAGAHFRSADDEAYRLAQKIIPRALEAVPPLGLPDGATPP